MQYLQFQEEYRGAAHYVDAPAVTDGDLITGAGTAPLEFAKEVLTKLDVFSPSTLDAWYQLHKTSAPQHFYALMQSIDRPA